MLGLLQTGSFWRNASWGLLHGIALAAISLYYYHLIGEKGAGTTKAKLVKSSSMKDLSNGSSSPGEKSGKADWDLMPWNNPQFLAVIKRHLLAIQRHGASVIMWLCSCTQLFFCKEHYFSAAFLSSLSHRTLCLCLFPLTRTNESSPIISRIIARCNFLNQCFICFLDNYGVSMMWGYFTWISLQYRAVPHEIISRIFNKEHSMLLHSLSPASFGAIRPPRHLINWILRFSVKWESSWILDVTDIPPLRAS